MSESSANPHPLRPIHHHRIISKWCAYSFCWLISLSVGSVGWILFDFANIYIIKSIAAILVLIGLVSSFGLGATTVLNLALLIRLSLYQYWDRHTPSRWGEPIQKELKEPELPSVRETAIQQFSLSLVIVAGTLVILSVVEPYLPSSLTISDSYFAIIQSFATALTGIPFRALQPIQQTIPDWLFSDSNLALFLVAIVPILPTMTGWDNVLYYLEEWTIEELSTGEVFENDSGVLGVLVSGLGMVAVLLWWGWNLST